MRQEPITRRIFSPTLLHELSDAASVNSPSQRPLKKTEETNPRVDYQFLVHPEKLSIYSGEQASPQAAGIQLPLLLHPTDAAKLYKALLQVHVNEYPGIVKATGRLQALDGINWIECELKAHALPGTYKDLLGWQVVAQMKDPGYRPALTEDSSALLMQVLAHFYHAGQWHYYPLEGRLELDPTLKSLLQLPLQQPLNIHEFIQYILPEDRTPLLKKVFQLQRKGGFFEIHLRLDRHFFENIRSITLYGKAVVCPEGSHSLSGLCFINIASEAEKSSSFSNSFLEEIQNLGKLAFFTCNPTLNKLEASPHLQALLGLKTETYISLDQLKEIIQPADYASLKVAYHHLLSRKDEQELSLRIRSEQGQERVLWVRVKMLLANDGTPSLIGLAQDISDGIDRQAQIQTKDRLIGGFLKNLPVSIMSINKDERIVSVVGHGLNKAGLDRRKIIGKSLEEHLPTLLPNIREVLRGTSKSFVTEHVKGLQSFSFFNHYYYDEERQLAIGFTLDVTQQKQAEITARHVHQLEHRFELMDTFVHAVAHDLRAPVVNLDMLLNFFMEEKGRTQQEKYVAAMSNGIQHLKRSLDGLIEILRIEKDSSISADDISFQEIIDELQQEYAIKLADEKGSLKTFFQCSSIYYNRAYLTSILRNLISNAIKYSDPNKAPQITICTEKRGKIVLLFVQDNGIGINLKKWGHLLFKPFKRLHTLKQGTGMGLHLIKQIVEKNGGKIKVKSKPGEGTTFYCFLRPYC